MFNQPSNENEPDLFDLAAKLAGCEPVDLLKVRRGEGSSLVVILLTGQKFTFAIPDGAELTGELLETVRSQLVPEPAADAAAPADKPPKPKRTR